MLEARNRDGEDPRRLAGYVEQIQAQTIARRIEGDIDRIAAEARPPL